MGLLRKIKNSIEHSLGISNADSIEKKIGLYTLTDEKDRLVDTFRISTNNFDNVHMYVKSKQRCTVKEIELVVDKLNNLNKPIYYIHAHDCNGKPRKFKMERLT